LGKLKILTVVGARPQIIKAAAFSRAVRTEFSDRIQEIILHTGQHYDENMSEVFFQEMSIPKPDYRLNIGSSSHGKQTGEMMAAIEEVLLQSKPDALLVYGDTNSTLAGALAASKIHIPVVHVEAGLRSFNKSMPEEINRICTDHVSTFLFCPTETAVENLKKEGFRNFGSGRASIDNPLVVNAGDVMYDNSLYFSELSDSKSDIISKYNLEPNEFLLLTIHRDFNTDQPERLASILKSVSRIADEYQLKIVFPCHPRTSKLISNYTSVRISENIMMCPPVSFFEMIQLEKQAKLIITDSGGVQKESYFFQKPCIVLRPETEWVEIIETGNGILADANEDKIISAFNYFANSPKSEFPEIYGIGRAAFQVAQTICDNF
jgi:UDP-GlcNAc3NAcA epimerase